MGIDELREKGDGEVFEITVRMQNNEIDMLVPKKVTFERFQTLLAETFSEHGTKLPETFLLKIKGKTVRIEKSDFLHQFGIGMGERIEIISGEGGNENEII